MSNRSAARTFGWCSATLAPGVFVDDISLLFPRVCKVDQRLASNNVRQDRGETVASENAADGYFLAGAGFLAPPLAGAFSAPLSSAFAAPLAAFSPFAEAPFSPASPFPAGLADAAPSSGISSRRDIGAASPGRWGSFTMRV